MICSYFCFIECQMQLLIVHSFDFKGVSEPPVSVSVKKIEQLVHI